VAGLRHQRQQAYAEYVKARALHAVHARRGVFNVSPWPLLFGVVSATLAMLFVIFMLWRERQKEQLQLDAVIPQATAEEVWIDVE
jgi:hypothetical protein